MRTIRLELQPNGSVKYGYTGSIFQNEHNVMEVEVDYSAVPDYVNHIKRVEVDGLTTPRIYEESVGNTVSFSIERMSLVGTTISFQAVAYILDGTTIIQEVKWKVVTFPVNLSLNLLENGTLPPSIVDGILDRIDEVEASLLAKMNTTADNSNIETLKFNVTPSTVTPLYEGEMRWNSTDRTLDVGLDGGSIIGQMFQETHYPPTFNASGSLISNGDLVAYSGAQGNSGVILISRFDTQNNPLPASGLGIATEDIPNNSQGRVTWFGLVRGIPTNGSKYGEVWVDGQILYNHPTILGGLSKNKPTAPSSAMVVGVVVNSHPSNGQILVRPTFFPHLYMLSDVYINTPQEGDVLVYNFDLKRWENSSRLTIPRWDDMNFPLDQSKVGSNLKPDYDYQNIGLLFPQNNLTEIVYITCQMPHAWVEGSDIFPHVHGIQGANQPVAFRMEYKWYNLGVAEPATWSTYNMTEYVFPYTSGRIAQIIKNDIPISGAGMLISSILKIKLYRTDNTYTGDFLLDQFDIHIQKDAFGSQLPYDKE